MLSGGDAAAGGGNGGYYYEILFHSLATPLYSVNAVVNLSLLESRFCSLV